MISGRLDAITTFLFQWPVPLNEEHFPGGVPSALLLGSYECYKLVNVLEMVAARIVFFLRWIPLFCMTVLNVRFFSPKNE